MMPNFVLCFGSKKAILQKLVVVLQVQISFFFQSLHAKKLMSKVNFDSFWNYGQKVSMIVSKNESSPVFSLLRLFFFSIFVSREE